MKIFATNSNMEKPVIITPEIEKQAGRAGNTEKNVKFITLAVTVVLLMATVVGGFVYVFKSQSKTSTEMHEIAVRHLSGGGLDETVEEDMTDNTKLYTINGAGVQQQVLYDFNRRLKLVKMPNQGCVVSAMNHTETDVENANGQIEASYQLRMDSTPVLDRSFLSERGQYLCKNQHVYWAFPNCGDDMVHYESKDTDQNAMSRNKRATTFYWCQSTSYCSIFSYRCNRGYSSYGCFIYLYEVCSGTVCSCHWYFNCPPY